MGVGLYLRGRSATDGWVTTLRERMASVTHPAAPPIDVLDEGVVSATTTPAGPGYHVAVCEALDDAARELAITWERASADDDPDDDDSDDDDSDDETGYFFDRDLAALEHEMLRWLRTVSTWVLENQCDGIQIGMSMSHQYRVGGALTPTGPRAAIATGPLLGYRRHPAPGDGEVLRRVDGVVDGKLCLSTIVYPVEDDRDWALQVWASFQCR